MKRALLPACATPPERVPPVDTTPSPLVTTLTASGPTEITGALEREGHGLFTFHFLESLHALGPRGDAVTAGDIFERLAPRLNGAEDAALLESR